MAIALSLMIAYDKYTEYFSLEVDVLMIRYYDLCG